MAIITETFFKEMASMAFGANKSLYLQQAEKKNKSKAGKTVIFLSHSHSDRALIEKAIPIFEKIGVDIYVDWKDDTLPEVTDKETANLLKERIRDSKFFILLASNRAIRSVWCNWELGIGDVLMANLDRIALFPLANDAGEWVGQEYLRLYPHIEPATEFKYFNYLYVYYPDGRKILVEDWIRKIGIFKK